MRGGAYEGNIVDDSTFFNLLLFTYTAAIGFHLIGKCSCFYAPHSFPQSESTTWGKVALVVWRRRNGLRVSKMRLGIGERNGKRNTGARVTVDTYSPTPHKLEQAMGSRPAAAAAACTTARRPQLDAGRLHQGANGLPAAPRRGKCLGQALKRMLLASAIPHVT